MQASQFGQSGIMIVPQVVVTATGHPNRPRAICKTAITAKITAATSE